MTKALSAEKKMTTREVAEHLGCAVNTLRETAKKCLPNKVFENGRQTYWNPEEITVVLEELKRHNNNQNNLSRSVTGISTELTPSLRMIEAFKMFQSAANDEIERLKAINKEQENQLNEQKPKVEFYDDVTGSNDTIDMKEVAKILNIKNVGRNKLFEILRAKEILDKSNQPYQKYVDRGYFRVIESRFTLPTGEVKISLKTVVFQKGLDFIRGIAKKQICA